MLSAENEVDGDSASNCSIIQIQKDVRIRKNIHDYSNHLENITVWFVGYVYREKEKLEPGSSNSIPTNQPPEMSSPVLLMERCKSDVCVYIHFICILSAG